MYCDAGKEGFFFLILYWCSQDRRTCMVPWAPSKPFCAGAPGLPVVRDWASFGSWRQVAVGDD